MDALFAEDIVADNCSKDNAHEIQRYLTTRSAATLLENDMVNIICKVRQKYRAAEPKPKKNVRGGEVQR